MHAQYSECKMTDKGATAAFAKKSVVVTAYQAIISKTALRLIFGLLVLLGICLDLMGQSKMVTQFRKVTTEARTIRMIDLVFI